jgi:hypothetical protein
MATELKATPVGPLIGPLTPKAGSDTLCYLSISCYKNRHLPEHGDRIGGDLNGAADRAPEAQKSLIPYATPAFQYCKIATCLNMATELKATPMGPLTGPLTPTNFPGPFWMMGYRGTRKLRFC